MSEHKPSTICPLYEAPEVESINEDSTPNLSIRLYFVENGVTHKQSFQITSPEIENDPIGRSVPKADGALTRGKHSKHIERPRVAEFFAGIGLVRLALEMHGFQVVWANDVEPAKEQMYATHFGQHEFILNDIRHL